MSTSLSLRVVFRVGVVCILFLFGVNFAAAEDAKKSEKGKTGEENASEEGADKVSDYICEADVFYTWKRTIQPKEVTDERGQKKLIPPDPALIKPIQEFYTRVGDRGPLEQEVANRLFARLPGVEAEARAQCELMREDKAKCLTRKLSAVQDEYQRMDFHGRKSLLDAVKDDCERNIGVCIKAGSSKIACYEQVPPDKLGAEGEGEGGDEKKDKKKK